MRIIDRRSNGRSFFNGRMWNSFKERSKIKVCVALVSIIAGTNELLIVTGIIMSDSLIVCKEERPSRISFNLLGEIDNKVTYGQVDHKSNRL